MSDSLIFASDWLNSTPYFYNVKNKKSSFNINDVIDVNSFEFDRCGLENYLRFGYSAFGKTMIKNVFFLRSNQELRLKNGSFFVKNTTDPVIELLGKSVREPEIFDLIKENLISKSKEINSQKILIPTSGGYDSRLLNYLYPNKEKICSFTYGISANQANSFEAVFAKEISKRIGTRWQQVELGEFHNYFNEWDSLYGPSTHAHGMYQIEFFKKILKVTGPLPMLSGIVGDAWAGGLSTLMPNSPNQLVSLGLSHGLCGDHLKLNDRLTTNYDLEKEFECEREALRSERYRIVYLVRSKMILLSYLIGVPNSLGFQASSPFLDINIAMGMLSLPSERWKNRLWQTEYLAKNSLNVESLSLTRSYKNDLNMVGLKTIPPQKLDMQLMRILFDKKYIDWINRNIEPLSAANLLRNQLFGNKYAFAILRRMGVSNITIKAYSAYLVLKPIEILLKKVVSTV